MDIEKTLTQMRKGVLELCILSVISAKGHAYSSEILTSLKESKLIVVEGTLYPLLSRMKNDELLGYTWKESTQGPPRKYFFVTEKGQDALVQLKAGWEDFSLCVSSLMKI